MCAQSKNDPASRLAQEGRLAGNDERKAEDAASQAKQTRDTKVC